MELGLGFTRIAPLAVYLLSFLVVIIVLAKRVDVGLYFLVPMIPQQSLLDAIVQYPLGKDFVDILLVAMLVRWYLDKRNAAATRGKPPEGFLMQTPLNKWIFWFVLYTYLGLWYGAFYLGIPAPFSITNPRFMEWKNFMILPLLYLIAVNNIKSKRQMEILVLLMTISMLFMDRTVASMLRGKSTGHYSNELRVTGTFSHLGVNALAVFYAQFSAMVLAFFLLDRNKYRRLLFGATTYLNYFVLAFLFSRGGYVAAMFSWFFLGIYRDRRVLLALVVLIIFWNTLLPNAVVERIEMTKTEEGLDNTVKERFDLWEQAVSVFSENPIIGTGFNTAAYMGYKDNVTNRSRRSLHNGYLEFISENGLVGLFLFLSFYVWGVKLGLRLYRKSSDAFLKALGLGTAMAAVAAFGGNIAGSYWQYFSVSGFYWVLLALVYRGILMAEEEEKGSTAEVPMDNLSPGRLVQPAAV
ncbi:MAG: O-antigen ligase family protein [Calditrichaeota bacterium]|nr:MAG: O-antigen ligase family protein [Calditrichota bacterium]